MFVYLLIKIHVHLQILDLPLVFQMARQIAKKNEPQLAELPRVPLCPAVRCHPKIQRKLGPLMRSKIRVKTRCNMLSCVTCKKTVLCVFFKKMLRTIFESFFGERKLRFI